MNARMAGTSVNTLGSIAMNIYEDTLSSRSIECELNEGVFAALVKYAGYILWIHYSGLVTEADGA